MLHRIAFHSSGKVVDLHLENNAAKAHLHYTGGTVSSSIQTILSHMESV